jgi:5'-methylthioadenosine phosphorylase
MRIAVIGGSGFGRGFIPGEPETVKTEYGNASIIRGMQDDVEVVFLARHGTGHKIPPHAINHRANIAALRALEVSQVYATAAVGSLRTDMAPGDFVIVNDFVDFTKGAVTTFFDKVGDVRHTDFSEPYDPKLRGILIGTAEEVSASTGNVRVHSAGTYLCLSGPRYETPAEVRIFSKLGCDVVGMTGSYEAILCREIGLPYASIAIVTNYACGLVDATPLSHSEVEQQMERSRAFLVELFTRIARVRPAK